MNKYDHVYLTGINVSEPDEFISSDQIETELSAVYERLKLPFGRIEMQTGVKTRGIFRDRLPSEIAFNAAKPLFDDGIQADCIDVIIYCGVCRDFLEPSTVSKIHHLLGLRHDCRSFDLSNACLGMASAMELAAQLIEANQYQNILLVTGENSAPLLQNTLKNIQADRELSRKSIKKFFANFTIGSAGVAMVLSSDAGSAMAQLKRTLTWSRTSAHSLCQGGGDGNALTMETDSEQLMQEGIFLAKSLWNEFKQGEYQHYICHQVGIHHRDFLYRELELDLGKDTSTFPKYGNTGSAALPLTLFKAQDKFQPGDRVAMLGIGSGLHAMALELVWI